MVPRLRRLLHGKEMNPLFDQVWYLEQYPDVRAGELDPAARAAEGRDPRRLFDTSWYLKQNPTAAKILWCISILLVLKKDAIQFHFLT
jgi:hypothetical protein